ncbi:MAG: hypothetical protein IPN79_14650 [Saprospiraceae bacterium]|nr:hypothetical protein [Saprospiraceae bacterium]
MKNIVLLLLFLVPTVSLFSQNNNVGIGTNTPDPSAILELSSTNQGLRLTRVPTTASVSNPVNGLLIFSESDQKLYYYNGTTWKELIHTEADPKVSSTSTNKVPRWNGTALADGTIRDDDTNVGIGTAPVANQKLTVSGKTTTDNFQMTTGAANGFVLQSDVTGNATWVNANTLGTLNLYNSNGTLTSPRTLTQENFDLTFTNNGTQNTIFNLTSTGDFDIQKNGASTLFVGDNGRVGINTSTPLAQLHVKDSSMVFTGLFPLPAVPGNPPVSGTGTRMMWYPDKAAFRVGSVNSTTWDQANVGIYSIAMGYNTQASGESSTALGRFTEASGESSTAIGRSATASGQNSTAIGNASTASGLSSFAIGTFSTASGDGSISMGGLTIASNINSIAMGSYSNASGVISTSMGYSTTASGPYSTATGFESIATGASSFTLGMRTNASGNGSLATGELTKASGHQTVAMGKETTARSLASLVLGRFNDSIATSSKNLWVVTDPVFIIGNGDSDANRKNALTVYKNGTLQLENQTSTPANHSDKFYVLNNVPYYGDKILNSQLEKITEVNTGWRLLGSNPNNFGNIGTDAVDLSISQLASATKGATGANSTAMGNSTTASGTNSTAMGFQTISKAFASLSLGRYNDTIAGSDPINWVVTDPVFMIGNGTSDAVRKNVMTVYKNGTLQLQNLTSTPANNSDKFYVLNNRPFYGDKILTGQLERITENGNTGWRLFGRNPANYGDIGDDAVDLSISLFTSATRGATGYTSIAMGSGTTASGLNSTAMGSSSIASGNYSTAIGNSCTASEDNSIAMGSGTDAIGVNSITMGFHTLASGSYSSAMGFHTFAKSYGSLSIGRYSDSIATSSETTWVATDPVFIIGNGDSNINRKNAVTILKNAKTGINTSTPGAGLHIKGVDASWDSHIRLETVDGGDYGNILYDGNMKFRNFGADDEFQWRNSASSIKMRLEDNGDLTVAGNTSVGGLTITSGSVSLNGDNQLITVGGSGYLKLSSNHPTATNRTIVLSDGLTTGQILYIESTSAGANLFEIQDGAGSNTNTTGTITMSAGHVIQLLWNGTDWLQVSYANN